MHQPQDGLVQFFSSDHRHCDELWASFEAACDPGSAQAEAAWKSFEEHTLQHFALEESSLFPAFEQRTGMVQGPTQMMRLEHARMREMLDLIRASVQKGEFEEALDQGDTLLLFTQQHNQKEETMLYPMAERALAADWPALATSLSAQIK